MLTKRYEAETLNEALVAARQDLGEGVVVLHSKRKIVGGIPFLGNLFGRESYEVLVGVAESGDSDLPPYRPAATQAPPRPRLDLYDDAPALPQHDRVHTPPTATPAPAYSPRPTAPSPTVAHAPENGHHPGAPMTRQQPPRPPVPPPAAANEDSPRELRELRQEIQSLKDAMGHFMEDQRTQHRPAAKWQGNWAALADQLKHRGVLENTVDTLLEEARTLGGAPTQALRTVMHRRLVTTGGVVPTSTRRPYVCVFVGPTGVGKTTTIAKIAAGLTLLQNYNVCLASADTYRIAAVDQLKTYAEIIGTPLEVLYGASDVPGLLERHTHTDILLVDTAGRSPRAEDQMAELQLLIDALQPQETHFVVAANLHSEDSLGFMERFGAVGFNRLAVTKLDETQHPGVLVNLALRGGYPISYVTTGQSVPDDILEPTAEDLTAWVLGERGLP